ncbi:molybdopterin molybdotransferase MoeA [Zunongwangia sp. H14]|uniref:molybdopterin molybdotransferase MoeA n=1 Tax=Zunongwangia sp. H14 TaxID=3240792 RepID=UPI00356766B3
MIPVKEALALIAQWTPHLKIIETDLMDGIDMVLAKDVYSPLNMPPFRQSAMDGYAIKWSNKENYKIIGESKAGDNRQFQLNEGEAVRIFTGAMVPKNADTVVIQEHVEEASERISIKKMPAKRANIRAEGEQILKGVKVLEKGSQVNEASIGLLAGLGLKQIKIFKPPEIGLMVTGNELEQLDEPLAPGKIYESNSLMLKVALKRNNFPKVKFYQAKDNAKETARLIKEALANNDVLLISGGISVGKYDFVQQALLSNGVKEIFYKVNQKPGKPLWFGAKGEKRIFALPGNPASMYILI